jgi:hypothetical protein
MIPARRKRPKMMAPKDDAPIKCPGHMKWVRGHECSVAGKGVFGPLGTFVGFHECEGRMEAHHVKSRGAGGGDEQVVPLCSLAHKNIHDGCGFSGVSGSDLALIAKRLWQASPHRVAYERRISAPTSLPSPTPTNPPEST